MATPTLTSLVDYLKSLESSSFQREQFHLRVQKLFRYKSCSVGVMKENIGIALQKVSWILIPNLHRTLIILNTNSLYNSQYKKNIYLHPQYSIHFKLNNGKFWKYILESHIDVFKELSSVNKNDVFLLQSTEYVMYSKQLFVNNSTFQISGSGIYSILHFKYFLLICS